jgi:hypothetical protein
MLDWWVAPLDGGEPRRTGIVNALRARGLMFNAASIRPADWLGNQLVFSIFNAGMANLWDIPLSPATWLVSGPAQRLTQGPGSDTYVRVSALSAGAARAVFVSEQASTHLWRLPIAADQALVTGALAQLTHDTSLSGPELLPHPALSADGSAVAFASARSGNLDIWIRHLVSGQETALTANPWLENRPVIAADGARVAYQSVEGPARFINVVEVGPEGRKRPPRRICRDCGNPMSWSAGGRYLLSGAGEPQRLWLIDLATGGSADLVNLSGYNLQVAAFSPDSKWIALVADHIGDGKVRTFLAPFHERSLGEVTTWVPIPDFRDASVQWSPDGNTLYSLSDMDDFRCVWAQRLDTTTKQPLNRPVAVQHFHALQQYPWATSMAVARDKLVLPLMESSSNIWSAELKVDPRRE